MQKFFVSVSLLLLFFFGQSAFADVHKWKDAEGKTHYGDAPTAGRTEIIKVRLQNREQVSGAEIYGSSNRRDGKLNVFTGVGGRSDAIDQFKRDKNVQSLHEQNAAAHAVAASMGGAGGIRGGGDTPWEQRLQSLSPVKYAAHKDQMEKNRLQHELQMQNAQFRHDNPDEANNTARYPAEQNNEQNAPPMPAPPTPSIITSCDPGGCWDNLGGRYNKGGGDTYFPTSGGACQMIGGMMHCP